MLAGIGLAGLVALFLILLDTWRARQGGAVGPHNSSRMFRVFQAPVGLALAGFGSLLATVAFPLDDYWHSLYGIDVTLWAPFHVMIIAGVLMIGLGTLYVVASEMNRLAVGRTRTLAEGGFLALLAVVLSTLTLFLVQGESSEGLIRLGSYEFVVYPVLVATALPIFLVSALLVTRRPGAATFVALVFVAIRQAMFVFVPWAMDQAVAAEGLAYRPNGPQHVLTPFAYPAAIIVVGLALDLVYGLTRRQGRTGTLLLGAMAVIAPLAITLWEKPWLATLATYYYPNLDANGALLRAMPFTVAGALAGLGLAVLLSRGLRAVRQ
jgi:hypothetical protein